MSEETGWEPLKGPRVGAQAFQVTPFMRLARTHAASMGGNALVVFALAGSVFFTNPEESRERVALTLAMTMVPFAVLAPMVGPWLDRMRGGRRWVVMGANALRVVVCLLMIRELDSLALYPLAFLVLMLDKSYNLAKSAIVPSTVRSDEELVRANSTLTRLSGIAGAVVAAPGGLAMLLGENVDAFTGPQASLALATLAFVVATSLGAQIPSVKVAEDRTSEEERHELRSAGILLAASAMGLMRGILGFMTWLLAFELQENDATWEFALVVVAGTAGSFLGTIVAPALRSANVPEERILQIVLGATGAFGLLCAYIGGIGAATAVVLAVGTATSAAKLSFDAIVQKDAPDANRGRAFARFETRFQLVWVAGAYVPVLISIPMRLGFVILSGVAVFALASYLTGLRAVAAGRPPPQRTKNLRRRLRTRAAARRRTGATAGAPADGTTDVPAEPATPEPATDPRPPPPQVVPEEDATVNIDPTKLH